MERKKVLIFSGVSIFPIVGMHQVRILNQIKTLSRKHDVDLLFLFTKKFNSDLTIKQTEKYCRKVIPFQTYTQSFLFRLLKKVILARLFEVIAYPLDFFTLSNSISAKQIARRIEKENYHTIISHYWQASGFLKHLRREYYKCIDTHYLVEENIELHKLGAYNHIDNPKLGKSLIKELLIQNQIFDCSNLLIVNSDTQKEILDSKGKYSSICIPNGQDLDFYLNYETHKKDHRKTILFYGSLANQFNQKAIKRIINTIWPGIRDKYNDTRLIIMGSSPPQWLINVAKEEKNIEVTGFVEDVREIFAQSTLALIPLDSGSGFRGRTIELMASGIPVIGTQNALQSIKIIHGITGFIADNDKEIIYLALRLMQDQNLRENISKAGKAFVSKEYNLEGTFGKLNEYLKQL